MHKMAECQIYGLCSTCRIVKETIGKIAESEKEVEWAAREVEYIIRWVGSTSSGGWGVHHQVIGEYIIRWVGSTSAGGWGSTSSSE